MKIEAIYLKLHQFVMLATGLDSKKVVPLYLDMKIKPKKPYIAMTVSSFRNTGTPISKVLNGDGELTTTVSMVFTASFQAFSDLPYQSEELLSDLYINFSTELQTNIFDGEMAKRRTLKHVSSIPSITNEQIENRAILEVEMGYLKSITEQAGLIEAIEWAV